MDTDERRVQLIAEAFRREMEERKDAAERGDAVCHEPAKSAAAAVLDDDREDRQDREG